MYTTHGVGEYIYYGGQAYQGLLHIVELAVTSVRFYFNTFTLILVTFTVTQQIEWNFNNLCPTICKIFYNLLHKMYMS